MQQFIFIVCPVLKKVDIRKIKEEIKLYVGTRLIEDDDIETPGLYLKSVLDPEDMEHLSTIVQDDARLIFIDIDADKDKNEYLHCELV